MLTLKSVALSAVLFAVSAATVSASTMEFTAGREASAVSWNTTFSPLSQEYTESGSVLDGGTDYKSVALYHFDLSTLPTYSAINSVTLGLTVKGGYNGGSSASMGIYRVANTYSNWQTDATWIYSTGTTAWTGSVTMDQVGTGSALASTDVISTTVDQSSYWTVDGSVASTLVNDWKLGTNSGLLLMAASGIAGADSRTGFYLASSLTPPTLTVNYTPIPEPSTITLLVAGVFSLLAYAWRKRK